MNAVVADESGIPELSDGVVTLRVFQRADAADYAALNRDPVNVRWANSRARMTAGEAEAAITGAIPEGWSSGHTRRFAIVDSAGALVGTTALHNVGQGSASLGIKLAADARGKGLARRAAKLMADYAFDILGLAVLHWHAVVGNTASRRLAEHLGFTLEGTITGYSNVAGAPADAWILTLTAQGRLAPAMVVPVLRGDTVVLRALDRRDADELVANCLDPAAVQWTTVPLNYSRADALSFINDFVPKGWTGGETHTFAVADSRTDALLGTIDLHNFRPGSAEIGINMGPQSRGTGAAAAAAHLLLDYAFSGLALQYVYWRALLPNWASRKLAWKMGFRLEAQLRGFSDDRGMPTDAWILTLADSDPRQPQQPWDGARAGDAGSLGEVPGPQGPDTNEAAQLYAAKRRG
ncbi:GNAT family N-acetyltransferase [Paeniglutamicibacter antarcticus]|uniref:GNAT family N-acetyltransferase n=1 Tax=Arthrobacter terrae TaxID=2935737 RepID=A0A931CNP0_9MICC|nr:GNAT family protein [Arthrobacter terrae]MBG0739281.1 GNAT family N-acetyltransferase [Arthrobacter terrae]